MANTAIEAIQEQFNRYEILIEFKNLQNRQHCPRGMYMHPSTDSIYTWYGVMFPPTGPYCPGVFKFAILIPDDYPATGPSVSFLTEVWHPLVDPQSKWFDISARFPTWRKHQHFICQVLWYIYECFTEKGLAKLDKERCVNRDALVMFQEERDHFYKCVQNVVQLSQTDGSLYDTMPLDNPIRFAPISDDAFKELMGKMVAVGKEKMAQTTRSSEDNLKQLIRSASALRSLSQQAAATDP
ncbi:hypothetical protein RI367_001260 [Sorochytrium milnesiophthora]